MLEQERKLKINIISIPLWQSLSISPYVQHIFYSYNHLLAIWAITKHLAGPKVQLKNFWESKAAHNNLGRPAKDLGRQKAGQD